MVSAFIEDGQYDKAFIKSVDGGWPDVRFTFRPLTKSERMAYLQDVQKKPTEYAAKTAKVLADKIKEWNLGTSVTVERIRKLRPALFDRLTDIVFGDTISDHDPEWDKETESEHMALLEETGDRRPGDVAAEKREGN